MGFRVNSSTTRPPAMEVFFDGHAVVAYPGETVAAALIAGNIGRFRTDTNDRPRGAYCNMGTCFECLVEIRRPDPSGPRGGSDMSWYRVRACLTPVSANLEVRTAASVRALGQ
jgi:hypothetical protein